MSRASLLVAKIRALDERAATQKRETADERAKTVAELAELVGVAPAAELLGVSRAAIYKSALDARKRKSR
jgi:hypothetical protein